MPAYMLPSLFDIRVGLGEKSLPKKEVGIEVWDGVDDVAAMVAVCSRRISVILSCRGGILRSLYLM